MTGRQTGTLHMNLEINIDFNAIQKTGFMMVTQETEGCALGMLFYRIIPVKKDFCDSRDFHVR